MNKLIYILLIFCSCITIEQQKSDENLDSCICFDTVPYYLDTAEFYPSNLWEKSNLILKKLNDSLVKIMIIDASGQMGMALDTFSFIPFCPECEEIEEQTEQQPDTLIIQAEDYENFYDDTPENLGGEYRNDAVDIEKNPSGGYSVGWFNPGEWLEYSFPALEEGFYDVVFVAAAWVDGGYIDFVANDGFVDEIDIINTGDYYEWAFNKFSNLLLKEGLASIRVECVQGEVNFDKLLIIKK